MTNEERLKALSLVGSGGGYDTIPYQDIDWLIARVKVLTEAVGHLRAALETYRKAYPCNCHCPACEGAHALSATGIE